MSLKLKTIGPVIAFLFAAFFLVATNVSATKIPSSSYPPGAKTEYVANIPNAEYDWKWGEFFHSFPQKEVGRTKGWSELVLYKPNTKREIDWFIFSSKYKAKTNGQSLNYDDYVAKNENGGTLVNTETVVGTKSSEYYIKKTDKKGMSVLLAAAYFKNREVEVACLLPTVSYAVGEKYVTLQLYAGLYLTPVATATATATATASPITTTTPITTGTPVG